eukprot:5687703-Pleurochrysis_carterae.AAC.4
MTLSLTARNNGQELFIIVSIPSQHEPLQPVSCQVFLSIISVQPVVKRLGTYPIKYAYKATSKKHVQDSKIARHVCQANIRCPEPVPARAANSRGVTSSQVGGNALDTFKMDTNIRAFDTECTASGHSY